MAARRLIALPGVQGDLQALPSRRLQEIALSRIAAIRDDRLQGRPLGMQARTGDLSDCRKLYFDERADRAPTWRIVYRDRLDNEVEILEIVAAGARAAAAVHALAAERLERAPADTNDPEG